MAPYGYRCNNPFRLVNHRKTKNLRKVSTFLVQKWGGPPNVYVCASCRKRLLNESPPVPPEANVAIVQCSQTSSELSQNTQDEPFIPEDKFKHNSTQTDTEIESVEILKQLKEKFNDPSTSIYIKNMILTIAPKSWTENKLAEEFGTSRRQAKIAKLLVDQFGILSSPNPRGSSRKLSAEVENMVKCFYLREDISRIMPGKKDFISIKLDDNKRTHVQKQLLMCNINELYQKFKEEYPNVRVGLTKFFTLRPKQCILAGNPGTHMVCVCTYHQNVKLMLEGGAVANLTAGTAMELSTYKDCLRLMMCSNPTQKCHLMTTKSPPNECCQSCPGLNALREHLNVVLDNNQVTEVRFEKWLGTDRFTISTQILSSDDFVDNLCDALETLKPHAYIAEEQAFYFKRLKETIDKGEIIVQCDFAENYSFVVQDSAQSFHWNNDQATLLTSVFYYRDGTEIKHGSIVMISDDLKHDTATYYTYQKILHKHLSEKEIVASKIIYITDGASQHFKNRFNFVNLIYYKDDFNINAEAHFHATSHGKGPCDGLGGNLKRLATRASLQLPPSRSIISPMRLYDWAKSSLKQTAIYYCSKDDIERQRIFLQARFDSAATIPGTKKFHAFIPKADGLLVKRTSSTVDSHCKIVKIIK